MTATPLLLVALAALLLVGQAWAAEEPLKSSNITSNATEAAALLKFKAALRNSKALASWDKPAAMCTNWTGVWCSPRGQVTRIDLSGRQEELVGPLDWGSLAQLSAVTDINLEVNQLTGTLGAELPPALQTLQLGDNNLTGTLPQAWDLPPALKELYLNANQLSGTLPAKLRLPDGLQILKLDQNRLSGTLSPELQFPDSVQALDLSLNRFTGTLPPLRLPAQLKALYLGFNELEGPLPEGWVLPDGLAYLSVGTNRLSGSLPTSWHIPETLNALYLENNTFSGAIPAAFWACLPANMTDLNLSQNRLTGTLLADAAIPQAMMTLMLFNNSLHGTLPFWPTLNATNVEVMPQNGTSFCGEIPPAPTYTPYLNPDFDEKVWNTPLSLPPCLPGTDQPDLSAPSASPAPYPVPVPAPESSGSSTGAIIGGVVGGVVAAAAIVALTAWWCRVKSRKARAAAAAEQFKRTSPSTKASSDGGAKYNDYPPSKAQLSSLPSSALPSGTMATPKQSWELEGPKAMPAVMNSRLTEVRVHTPALSEGSHTPGPALSSAVPSVQEDPILQVAIRAAKLAAASGASGASGVSREMSQGMSQGMSSRASRHSMELELRRWEIDYHSLELIKQVGEGSFGRVYMGRWHQTTVAVKILLSTSVGVDAATEEATRRALTLSNPVLVNLHKEAGLMAAMRHPNIVGFLGVVAAPPCVVTEFCARGAVSDILRVARLNPAVAEKLDWYRRVSMMLDTARGMLYLHSRSPPIIHRDLKSPNLLVDQNWRVKVSDFNLSRILEDTVALSSAQATNPRWLPPEVLAGGQAVLTSDVYAFAVVMWEMLTWELPFEGENIWQLAPFVAQGGRLPIPDRAALPGKDTLGFAGLDTYIAIMKRCWSQDPAERPSFKEVADDLRELLASMRGPAPPPSPPPKPSPPARPAREIVTPTLPLPSPFAI